MPTKLLLVLILLCLNLATNLYNLSGAFAGTADYVRIGLNVALLVGLLRGQEWARVLAKVTAVLTLVAGAILLLQALSLGGAAFVIPQLGIFLYGMITLALVYGVFLLWCMNQADVQEWLMSRTMRD
ncbi:MAG: hypothetical protein IPO88_29675 [Nannocystis sp.]|uniref:hypothetical protein n=1 Tax=Nannocystis sp. TaxID=1962667 RepID=UPI002422D618|nr:hypothetical protein [Nannocystis sp.]MBK9757602.1 hypothetical protein [Nannocystis sp.]